MAQPIRSFERKPWLERLVLFGVSFAFWCALVWPVSPVDGRLLLPDLLAGLVVATGVALIMREMVRVNLKRFLDPRCWFWAFAYMFVFTYYVISAASWPGRGGWLFSGALKTMNGVPFSLSNLDEFVQAGALPRWLAGLLLGVILLLLVRRCKHYLITPSMIVAGVLLFYLILALTGTSAAEARQDGLLFQPFPSGSLWRPPPLAELGSVDWGAIGREAGEVATLILISSITLLLYASGVEVTAGAEIGLNRELRACGTGNLAAAFSASPPGYTIITMSVLSHRC